MLIFLPKIHKPLSEWRNDGKTPPGGPISFRLWKQIIMKFRNIWIIFSNWQIITNQRWKIPHVFLESVKYGHTIKPDSLLITLDVKSMFTNIDNKTGIIEIKEAFQNFPLISTPRRWTAQTFGNMLTENDFEFNGEKVLQISGTSMGKTFAPNYCNVVMAEWESKVFLIWDHGIENVWQFFKLINNHQASNWQVQLMRNQLTILNFRNI